MTIDPAAVANYLNKKLNANSVALLKDAIIPATISFVESACGRKWNKTGSYTEKFNGGVSKFFIANVPAATITSVSVDGSTLQSTEYFLYSTHVEVPAGTPYGNQNVVIAYTTTTDMPADLQLAIVQWSAEILENRVEQGKNIKRKRVGPIELEFASDLEKPSYIDRVIKQNRLMRF